MLKSLQPCASLTTIVGVGDVAVLAEDYDDEKLERKELNEDDEEEGAGDAD